MTLFAFPDPVNEVSARVVAAGVVVLGAVALVVGSPWIVVAIALGFLGRVLTGPTLSPLGQLATRVVTPRLPAAPRPVPGPPKRFAQAVGLVVSGSAAVVALVAGFGTATVLLIALMIAAATLESVLGFCLGCKVFAGLMRVGVIPQEVCERCADLGRTGAGRGTA
jgi:hypothetical protein